MNIGNPEELSVLAIAELVRELAESRSEIVFIERPGRRSDRSAA
ncbi:MAG TPA: hypothetical protein VLR26_09845 [Frankiaceae bacterium]|nr:hypothetical protein [Frankiaceae bacterium]